MTQLEWFWAGISGSDSWFWPAFWPEVLATLLGVALGVPIALWFDRLTHRRAERERIRQGHERLGQGLRALITAMVYNEAQLEPWLRPHDPASPLFELALDTSAWDASRDGITPFLSNLELHRRMAFHFGRIRQVEKLGDIYLNMAMGVGLTGRNWDILQRHSRNALMKRAKEVAAESRALREELESFLKQGSATPG